MLDKIFVLRHTSFADIWLLPAMIFATFCRKWACAPFPTWTIVLGSNWRKAKKIGRHVAEGSYFLLTSDGVEHSPGQFVSYYLGWCHHTLRTSAKNCFSSQCPTNPANSHLSTWHRRLLQPFYPSQMVTRLSPWFFRSFLLGNDRCFRGFQNSNLRL